MDLTIKLAMSQGFTSDCTNRDNVYVASRTNNIPKSILRRSSTLTREALALADFIFGTDIDFLVFATKHGELNRTQNLLKTLAQKKELSPTQFAQSVHSTAAGLLTIANRKEVAFTTICASNSTFSMAMIEAISHIKCSPGAEVCIVLADESPPPELEKFIGYDDAGAVAIKLTAGSDFRLRFSSVDTNNQLKTVYSDQKLLAGFIKGVSNKQSVELLTNDLNISLETLQ
jgi:hypothetical protein